MTSVTHLSKILPATPEVQQPPTWRLIAAGVCASFVGIGLARFAYTPLLPVLIGAHWFSPAATVYLSAANLAGYLAGSLLARPLARRTSNRSMLRLMMLLTSLSLLACAARLGVPWFFGWRFVSGLTGGVIMVLVAGTVLPHIPGTRRGLASGAIFMGLGLGIAASGTVIPVLLHLGVWQTWAGLGVLCAALTAFSWTAWPRQLAAAVVAAEERVRTNSPGRRVRLNVLYGEYSLMALGLVPTMVFLVDFVSRGLGEATGTGSLAWILYGAGALLGPITYGHLADRLGFNGAMRLVLLVQAVAVAALSVAPGFVAVAILSVIIGSFPPGIVPLMLGRMHQVLPDSPTAQGAAWARGTTVFALFQALSGYGYSYLFAHSNENHRLLFVVGSIALGLCFALASVTSRLTRLDREVP